MKDEITSAARVVKPASGPASEVANEASVERAATLGALLRASRELRQLSLAEVSAQTHICVAHLSALEADEKLPVADAFARGYVKSYAAILGIAPEYLDKLLPGTTTIASVESAATIETDAEPSRSSGERTKTSKRRVGFRSGSSWSRGLLGSPDGLLRAATTTTLPLLLLCVVAFAYHAIDSEFDAARDESLARHALGQTPESLGTLAHEAVTAPGIKHSTRLTVGAARIPAAQASAEPLALADAQLTSNTQTADQTAALDRSLPDQRVNAPAVVASAIAARAASAGTGVDTYLPSRVETASAARSGQSVVPNANIRDRHEPVGPGAVDMIAQLQVPDRLVIEVYEDSWIDIRDAGGSRLYRNLARAGRRIDVSGSTPFSLHVGNAPGLEIQLNGETVPITRYRADNSARLTLASN